MTQTPEPIVVVGFDPSAAASHALDVALDFARRLNARLHVVHAVDVRDLPVDPDSADWEAETQRHMDEVKSAVVHQVGSWPGEWSYEVAQRGDPAEAIVGIAEQCDALMIVVGARPGHAMGKGMAHFLEGSRSVSRAVAHGKTPVLIVPSPDDDGAEPHG